MLQYDLFKVLDFKFSRMFSRDAGSSAKRFDMSETVSLVSPRGSGYLQLDIRRSCSSRVQTVAAPNFLVFVSCIQTPSHITKLNDLDQSCCHELEDSDYELYF